MKNRGITLALAAIVSMNMWGQESEWEAQTRITGYIATEANYFHDLKGVDRNYGVSLSEAGMLVNYQPIQNLTIKSVFVYRPDLSIDQMINEANAQWKANNVMNIKAGRFLTPLSPMNTYYYAPVNNSATLPMIISHHEFFPLNMDGVSVNGVIGENIKFDYDAFVGGYRNALWLKTGALGLFGVEDNYFGAYNNSGYTLNTNDINTTLSFGGGVHLGLSASDFLTIGVNAMKTDTEKLSTTVDTPFGPMEVVFDVNRFAYGLNFKAKYQTLQLLGEFWRNDMDFTNNTLLIEREYKIDGSFIELSNNFGKLTPYVRYEYHDAAGLEFKRYTTGITYKPIFETTFKLEYLFYDHEATDINGFVASVIYSF